MITSFLFYTFSSILVISALGVIASRNLVSLDSSDILLRTKGSIADLKEPTLNILNSTLILSIKSL